MHQNRPGAWRQLSPYLDYGRVRHGRFQSKVFHWRCAAREYTHGSITVTGACTQRAQFVVGQNKGTRFDTSVQFHLSHSNLISTSTETAHSGCPSNRLGASALLSVPSRMVGINIHRLAHPVRYRTDVYASNPWDRKAKVLPG